MSDKNNNKENLRDWLLAQTYLQGTDLYKKDYHLAIQLFKKGAEKGHLDSINSLADCYLRGIGIEQDLKEAFRLYSQSAECSDALGQNGLGWCYERECVKMREKPSIIINYRPNKG